MRFAVLIGNKKFPVSLMKEPKDEKLLSSFRYENKTYVGIVEQFNGLRKNKEKYTAISVIINSEKIISQIIPESEPEPEFEEETETTILIEEEIVSEIPEIFNTLENIKKDDERKNKQNIIIENKKKQYQPRWSYLFPESETFGEGIFEKQKVVWIKLHGSEHLKTAYEMQCKCDSLYIEERKQFEFKDWLIYECLSYYEIDSPDFGILTFLRNFKQLHKEIFNTYKSKIIIATTETNEDEDNPLVIITDYLGHADLALPLQDMVKIYGESC